MVATAERKRVWKLRLSTADLAAAAAVGRRFEVWRTSVSAALSWAVRRQAERENSLTCAGEPVGLYRGLLSPAGAAYRAAADAVQQRRGRGAGYDRARSVTLAAADHVAAEEVRAARGFACAAEALRFALRVEALLGGDADGDGP